MSDSISNIRLTPLAAPAAPTAPAAAPATGGTKSEFAGVLREQLDQVNRVQNEADEELKRVLTGQSQNLTEVFVAARKAEVAFSLLMEIRNKLVDAYEDLRQLRV